MPEHFKIHLIITLVVALFLLPLGLFLLRRGRRTRMKKIRQYFRRFVVRPGVRGNHHPAADSLCEDLKWSGAAVMCRF